MPTSSALRSGIKNYARYLNVLSGTNPYVAPPTGSYDLLETETLASAQASVAFTNLDTNYSADYTHLQIRISAKSSSGTGSSGNNLMRFNSDSAGNYSYHRLLAASDTSGTESSALANATGIDFGYIPRDNSGDGSYAGFVIDLLNPFNTNVYPTVRCQWGFWQSSVTYVGMNSGSWRDTTAISTISFATTSYSYASASRFSLYGWKTA